jgi:large subunit ribosomal protein L22
VVAVRAYSKAVKVAPKKLRDLMSQVRGKRVDEAMALLRFMPTPNARVVAKTVRSATANAENNYNMNPRQLKITGASVSEAQRVRRMWPRARGRGDIIHRRYSNIEIVVEEDLR